MPTSNTPNTSIIFSLISKFAHLSAWPRKGKVTTTKQESFNLSDKILAHKQPKQANCVCHRQTKCTHMYTIACQRTMAVLPDEPSGLAADGELRPPIHENIYSKFATTCTPTMNIQHHLFVYIYKVLKTVLRNVMLWIVPGNHVTCSKGTFSPAAEILYMASQLGYAFNSISTQFFWGHAWHLLTFCLHGCTIHSMHTPPTWPPFS